jgi:hypothetical protein
MILHWLGQPVEFRHVPEDRFGQLADRDAVLPEAHIVVVQASVPAPQHPTIGGLAAHPDGPHVRVCGPERGDSDAQPGQKEELPIIGAAAQLLELALHPIDDLLKQPFGLPWWKLRLRGRDGQAARAIDQSRNHAPASRIPGPDSDTSLSQTSFSGTRLLLDPNRRPSPLSTRRLCNASISHSEAPSWNQQTTHLCLGSAAIPAPIAAALLPYVPDKVARGFICFEYLAYLSGIRQGDRRGSNPRPSEPQSAVIRFWALPYVAESAYLS